MNKWIWLIAFSLGSLFIAPFCGVSWVDGVFGDAGDRLLFWELRVPRVLTAYLCGVGLSVGGLVFQAMFRNSLATPYTLGVVSGAALSVSIWVQMGITITLVGLSGASLAALVGALGSIGLVYLLARLVGSFSPLTMLLGGVILSFFFSSVTTLVQHFADPGSLFRVVRWLMGSLGGADIAGVFTVLPFVAAGVVLVWQRHRELDLLMLGDELAMTRGLDVERQRRWLFLAVSLMVAGVVSVCGPVGFVGIMVPHFCRLLMGVTHRVLVPASLLFGGGFLVWCDTLARVMGEGGELPVGVITALLGGPFFLWMLVTRRGLSGS